MIIEAPTRGRGDDKHGKPDEQILVARPNLGGLIATNFFVDFAENVGHELLGAVYPALSERRLARTDADGEAWGLRQSSLRKPARACYCSFCPRSVARSKNPEISRFKKSTSAGKAPSADAWPVTVPGTDRHHTGVADVACRLDRLEFGVEQVL